MLIPFVLGLEIEATPHLVDTRVDIALLVTKLSRPPVVPLWVCDTLHMPNCVMLLYTVVVTRFIGCVIRPNRFSNSRVEYRIAMTTGVATQIVTQWRKFKIDKTQ